MNDAILILVSVLIEIGIPAILIVLIFKYRKGRRYTVVLLGSVMPWMILYIAGTVFYLIDPDAFTMKLGFLFVMSFIFFGLSFVMGLLVSLIPYPRNLKMRFIMGLTSPFLVYGLREIWIRVG